MDDFYSRKKYALCYGFSTRPINEHDMWPEVQIDELPPPVYKNGPGRLMKVRIREYGEDVTRRRRPSNL